jgi:Ca-activated chloride channel family protein
LTTDGDALLALAESLHSGEIDKPGSDIGNAVRAALRVVESTGGQQADIVVLSDGEDQGANAASAAAEARAKNVTVHAVMFGHGDGATIPAGTGSLQDEQGQTVITKANPAVLQSIARETGGIFVANPYSAALLSSLDKTFTTRTAGGSRVVHVPMERYQWPLGLALAGFLGAAFLNRGAD